MNVLSVFSYVIFSFWKYKIRGSQQLHDAILDHFFILFRLKEETPTELSQTR